MIKLSSNNIKVHYFSLFQLLVFDVIVGKSTSGVYDITVLPSNLLEGIKPKPFLLSILLLLLSPITK